MNSKALDSLFLALTLLVMVVTTTSTTSAKTVTPPHLAVRHRHTSTTTDWRVRSLQEEDTNDESSSVDSDTDADADSDADEAALTSSDDGDDVGAPTERTCRTERSSEEVEFQCRSESDDGATEIEDKITYTVEARDQEVLKIKIEYEIEVETDTTETETETQYTVVFDRLIEYRNAEGGQEHFEWGIDEIIEETPLNRWGPLSQVGTDGNQLIFSAETADEMATFTFTIVQSDVGEITTNKMKIDFLLENYPWSEDGTFIALICHIETEQEVDIESNEGGDETSMDVLISFDQAVGTTGVTPFGSYTWKDTAEARILIEDANTTGTDVLIGRASNATTGDIAVPTFRTATVSVIASTNPNMEETSSGSTFNEIAFSFIGESSSGSNRIFWDPEAGIGYGASSGAVSTSMTLGGVLGCIASMTVLLALTIM